MGFSRGLFLRKDILLVPQKVEIAMFQGPWCL